MLELQARAYGVASDAAPGDDGCQLWIGLPANICCQWTTRMEAAPTRRLGQTRPVESGVAISVFSGAGGLDLGVEAAGFAVRAGVEWDLDAADATAGADQ